MNAHPTLYEFYPACLQMSLSAVNIYSEMSAIIRFLCLVWNSFPFLSALPPKKKLHSTSLHKTLALVLSLAVLKTQIRKNHVVKEFGPIFKYPGKRPMLTFDLLSLA